MPLSQLPHRAQWMMSEPFNTPTADLWHITAQQSEMTVGPDPMLDTISSIVPPAPPVHPRDLPPIRLLFGSLRNSLAIWPDYAFDVAFNRNTLFGIESA